MAFVYDLDGDLERKVNPETVTLQRIETDYWEAQCRELVVEPYWRRSRCGLSVFSTIGILYWENFGRLSRTEMANRLEHPTIAAALDGELRA